MGCVRGRGGLQAGGGGHLLGLRRLAQVSQYNLLQHFFKTDIFTYI